MREEARFVERGLLSTYLSNLEVSAGLCKETTSRSIRRNVVIISEFWTFWRWDEQTRFAFWGHADELGVPLKARGKKELSWGSVLIPPAVRPAVPPVMALAAPGSVSLKELCGQEL